ncbi:MAG: hypothetical protein PVF51_01275 [Nitrospirota bacterium]|jgi:hypothetical protein
MATPPAIAAVMRLREAFEGGGRLASGVHLPADVAAEIRREFHLMYGFDPGAELMTIYGLEVLSTNAPTIRFEE